MSRFLKGLTKRCTLFLPKHMVVTTREATNVNLAGYRIFDKNFSWISGYPALNVFFENIMKLNTYIVFKLSKSIFTLYEEHY